MDFPTAFIGELSPEAFGALTADQISSIQPNDFQYLSYDQVSSFSADGLSGLTELQINAMSLQPELPLWFTDEQVANMSTDAAAAFQIMVDNMSGGTQVAPDTTQSMFLTKIVMLNQTLQMMEPLALSSNSTSWGLSISK